MPREKQNYKRLKQDVLSDKGIAMIEQMAADNMSLKEIAKAIGISKSMLDRWIKEDDLEGDGRLGDACYRNSKMLNYQLQAALYEAALGAKTRTVETVARLKKDKAGNVRLRTTEKHVIEEQQAPNVAAIRYALNNTNPEKWRDKPVDEGPQEIDAAVNIQIVRAESNEEGIESSIFEPDEEDIQEEMAYFENLNENEFDNLDEWSQFEEKE